MAQATDVRVEATSMSTTTVRWTDTTSGGTEGVYRSTDGVSYTLIGTATTAAGIFEDTGLATGTKYWYKLSNDGGSNFSSVVTVWTHSCGVDPAQQSDTALPRVGNEVTPADFNQLADAVETGLVRFTSPDGRTCVACITDGALVLDCVKYSDCSQIEIMVDQNVNSISLPNCENSTVDLNFIIPPNVTRRIGGWPKGIGFTGDEGHQAPVSGGSSGRAISEFVDRSLNVNSRSGKSKPGTSTKGTAQGGNATGSGSCTCIPGTNGELTIKTCTPAGANQTRNSMNCSAGTKGLIAFACGGSGVYTWSKTGSGVALNKTTGTKISVSPAANSGSAVAGDAYWICGTWNLLSPPGTDPNAACSAHGQCYKATYLCDDSLSGVTAGDCSGADNCTPSCSQGPECTLSTATCCFVGNCPPNGGTGSPHRGFSSNTVAGPACATVGTMCDKRTPTMITNGCAPCGVVTNGATLTVTDSSGASATITLQP